MVCTVCYVCSICVVCIMWVVRKLAVRSVCNICKIVQCAKVYNSVQCVMARPIVQAAACGLFCPSAEWATKPLLSSPTKSAPTLAEQCSEAKLGQCVC